MVIGGRYIGVEMAENLRERGLEVDLVEMADQIMTPLDREMARDLEVHMRWHGVRLHPFGRSRTWPGQTADGRWQTDEGRRTKDDGL